MGNTFTNPPKASQKINKWTTHSDSSQVILFVCDECRLTLIQS